MSFAVIIPSKTAANLVPCLEAVRQNEPLAQILVMDDGIETDWLPRPDLEPCLFIRCEQPFIFSRNVNRGILWAIEHGYDGDVALNDDALIESPGGFSLMAAAALADEQIGVIGATTNLGHRCQKPKKEGLRVVDHFAFVAVYIPRRTIEHVGFLDEDFNTYGWEDNDYTHRVRFAGLKCAVHDGCYVDHGSLKSTFRGDPLNPAELATGRAIFERKWPGVPQ